MVLRFAGIAASLAPLLAPGTDHVIIYHLLIEGRGFARLNEGNHVPLEAGDIVIFLHGDRLFVENGSGAKALDDREGLKRVLSEGLKVVRLGGGGEVTKLEIGRAHV